MEEVLDLYEEPYDPARPVVCFDERPCQLLAETRAGLPPAPGRPARSDYEYQRHGSANVFGYFEPLRGWRQMEVTARRTKQDFAGCMRRLADEFYPDAETVRVVLDNLSTHTKAALYDTFPPAEARRLARKLEFHYTPKHGSWLNAVEIEFAALSKQCGVPPGPPAHRRPPRARARNRRLDPPPQRRRRHAPLAVPNRRRPHQAPPPLPDHCRPKWTVN